MTFVLIRGAAGSGKTTISDLVHNFLLSHGKKTAILHWDFFNYKISGEENNQGLVTEAILRLVDLYLQNDYIVIVEGIGVRKMPNGVLWSELVIAQAQKRTSRVLTFLMDVPLEEALKREQARNGGLGSDMIKKIHDAITEIKHKHEFIIDNRLNPNEVATKIVSEILK